LGIRHIPASRVTAFQQNCTTGRTTLAELEAITNLVLFSLAALSFTSSFLGHVTGDRERTLEAGQRGPDQTGQARAGRAGRAEGRRRSESGRASDPRSSCPFLDPELLASSIPPPPLPGSFLLPSSAGFRNHSGEMRIMKVKSCTVKRKGEVKPARRKTAVIRVHLDPRWRVSASPLRNSKDSGGQPSLGPGARLEQTRRPSRIRRGSESELRPSKKGCE
jgi:hypothetical protein